MYWKCSELEEFIASSIRLSCGVISVVSSTGRAAGAGLLVAGDCG
jgi:hypothetical protein